MNKNRFMRLIVWQLITGKKRFLTLTTGLSLLVLCFTTLPAILHNGIVNVSFWISFFYFCGIAMMALGASHIFENMSKENDRRNFLLLPATNGEKYLMRWLTGTLVYPLLFLTGFLLADVAQMIICLAIYHHCEFMGAHIPASIPNVGDAWFLCLCFYFYFQSVFVLGGCIFRCRPLIMTLLAQWIIGIVGSILFGILGYMFFESLSQSSLVIELVAILDNMNPDTAINLIAAILCIILLAFTALHHWIGYRLFCRMGLKSHRLFHF